MPYAVFWPRAAFAVLVVASLASCGKEQAGGGMHGFPPAEVTTLTLTTASYPVTFEYVGQGIGSNYQAQGLKLSKHFRS